MCIYIPNSDIMFLLFKFFYLFDQRKKRSFSLVIELCFGEKFFGFFAIFEYTVFAKLYSSAFYKHAL